MQFSEGASTRDETADRCAAEWVSGSRRSAALNSPAVTSRLEIKPSNLNVRVFITPRRSPLASRLPSVQNQHFCDQHYAFSSSPSDRFAVYFRLAIMLRKTCRAFACLLALVEAGGTLLAAAEGRPIVRTFEPSDTGGNPYYLTSVQDERGVLYFGCSVVLSFDGDQWRQYPVPGSYAVRGLALDQHHRLWVGAINEIGYFDRDATGKLSSYHSLIPMLPPGSGNLGDVWSVFAHDDGAVFVTSHSVLIWDGTRFQTHQLPGGRRILATESDGKIYMSNLLKGILVLEGGELKPLVSASAINSSGWFWLEKSGNGWLVVSSQGLARFSNGNFSIIPSPATTFIQQHIVGWAVRLHTGSICVSTIDAGLAVFTDSGEIKHFVTQKDGLLTNSVETVYPAADGSAWISSELGLSRALLDSGISFFDTREGLAAKGIVGMTESSDRLLVSTLGGAFELPLGGDSNSEFKPLTALSGLHCRDLVASGDAIYVAGYKRIDRLKGGQCYPAIFTDDDVLLLQASDLQPGTFLAADGWDVVRLKPTASGTLQATKLARLPDTPNSLAEDSRGTVWAGTSSRGIFQTRSANSGSPTPFCDADGKPFTGRSLVARVGSKVAICTESGVLLCGDDSSPEIPVGNSPHAAPVEASNPDPAGRIWIAYPSPFNDGARVDIIGRLSVDPQGLGHWIGFPIPGLATVGDISRLYVDHHGILWIGGSSGLLRIEPEKLQPVAAPHVPVIQATVAAGTELPWSHNTAALDFGSVEFARREAVRFQTRLLPGTGDWSEPTDNSHLTLAGLRDDAYDFEVRTINDAGLTSPPATWHFTVLPPWYRTKYAYGAWALLLLGACVGIIQWRSAYLRQRNLRLEELIQKRTEELQKANAAKSEFLANMSHEIRNPISGIVGLSIAMDDTALTGRQQQLMDSIRSCASLLATLVDDVLDFSKIEAGRIELRPAPFNLRATLEQCTAMVAEEIRDKSGSLSLIIAPELPVRFIGDASRVQQIIVNYLTNALKFSPGKPIIVGAEPAGPGRVRLYVKDRGPGLSEADIAVLFTKFTRLERARTGNIRGTGLGLAVCRLLATKMGGTVGVDSKPGDGSRFWVELPLPIALDTAPPPDPAAAMPAVPLRALIVEDIDYNGVAMQAVLRKLGIDSEIVTDGPSALARMLNSTYDVVFMDWNLPGMIGTEVVSRYRSLEPANRRTIIIATTAYSQDMNREACLQAGMDAFISKPFTPEKIGAALADLRESRRAAASVEIRSSIENSAVFAGLDLQFLRFAGADSSDGMREVIDRYLATFRDDIAAGWQALENSSSPAQLGTIAHRLCNHARMVKAETLIRLSTELESNGGLSRAERRNVLTEIEREFVRVRDILDSIRSSAQPA
ncbi:MAG TPA: ATP-binding protein [Opitutus sp.]|nr:ATP-binding protein [Opitutus sp.]